MSTSSRPRSQWEPLEGESVGDGDSVDCANQDCGDSVDCADQDRGRDYAAEEPSSNGLSGSRTQTDRAVAAVV